jgi:hypothetical protein
MPENNDIDLNEAVDVLTEIQEVVNSNPSDLKPNQVISDDGLLIELDQGADDLKKVD